jgi:hypothetical protein
MEKGMSFSPCKECGAEPTEGTSGIVPSVIVHAANCITLPRVKQYRENLIALYETLAENDSVHDLVNWEVFKKKAKDVGLHYDSRFGLMDKKIWETLKTLLIEHVGNE